MTKKETIELRKIFNQCKQLSINHSNCSRKLDVLIFKHWYEHFSENDIDPIIDTIDYGTNDITFNVFLEYMNDQCGPRK